MQVVLKWIAQALLIPLITNGCKSFLEWYRYRQELNKVKEENLKIAEELKNAKNKIEALAALNKL